MMTKPRNVRTCFEQGGVVMAEIGVHARGMPGLPEEHAEIPAWNSENWYFENFEVGDRIRSIRRTISEGEAMVFSYGLGLAATNCLNSFSYGYDRLRFIKPVFIGDTIYTIRENLEKVVKDGRWARSGSATRSTRAKASWRSTASIS